MPERLKSDPRQAPSGQDRLLSSQFILAFAATMAFGMSFFLFVHLPGLLRDLGASEAEIGWIFAATALASVLVRPVVGRAMDRHGRRPVVILGAIVNAGVIALYYTVTAIGPWVYVVRVLHGVAAAMLFTSLFTVAADFVPETRRTQGLALFGIAGMLPIALGGLLGDAILAASGFDALFTAALVLALLALALSLPLHDAVGAVANPSPHPFLDIARRPELQPLWWMTAVFAMGLTAYFTFLKTWVDETGVGSVGLFFAFYAGTAIVLRLVAGWLPDRVGQKRVLFPALGSFVVGFVVLAGAGEPWHVAVAGILCGLGHGYVFPILYSIVVTRTPSGERGSAMALYTALFDVGALIAAPVFGVVISLGSYEAMFLGAALLVAIGTAVFAAWDGRREPAPVS